MKNKKAILALVLVVAIVAAFAACSKSSKDDKGSTSQITAAVTDSNGEAVTDENGVIVTEKVGGEVVTDTVQLPGNQADAPMPLYMMMKAADFDAMVDKHPDCGVIVTTVGLPQDANRLKFMKQSADKRPALFLMGLPSGPVPGIMAALQSGIITGLIISNPDAKYDVPAPSDPMKAFDIRYVLVTKENADQYKAHFSN